MAENVMIQRNPMRRLGKKEEIPWESIHRVFETVLNGEMAAVGSRRMKDSKHDERS